jgi:hypothetical protein
MVQKWSSKAASVCRTRTHGYNGYWFAATALLQLFLGSPYCICFWAVKKTGSLRGCLLCSPACLNNGQTALIPQQNKVPGDAHSKLLCTGRLLL